MDDEQKAQEEAAAASGYNSKRYVSLVRFTSVLIDQTTESKLTPDEMRFVGEMFRQSMNLIANDVQRS